MHESKHPLEEAKGGPFDPMPVKVASDTGKEAVITNVPVGAALAEVTPDTTANVGQGDVQ